MQDTSSKQQTKQKHKHNHQQTGLPPHSALPIRGKTKQTNKQKLSINLTLCEAYTNHCTNLRGGRNQKEERIQPLRLGQGDLKNNKLKKIMKRQRNTTQMNKKLETQKSK